MIYIDLNNKPFSYLILSYLMGRCESAIHVCSQHNLFLSFITRFEPLSMDFDFYADYVFYLDAISIIEEMEEVEATLPVDRAGESRSN